MDQKALEEMVFEQKKRISAIEESNKNKPDIPSINKRLIAGMTNLIQLVDAAFSSQSKQLNQAIEEVRKPVVTRHTIDLTSKGAIVVFMIMLITIVVTSTALYFESRPNYDQRDNNLKYRYIKMKGYATPAIISELEDLFELNRDADRIHQMLNDVETFEKAVHKKAQLDEQTRLNQLELERLKH